MRHAAAILSVVFGLCCGCATRVRIVSPRDAAEVSADRLADELARADVVVLGEQHDSSIVHRQHWRILRDLYARRGDLIVSMEMFERDVQPVVWQYLLGDIDESEFLAKARPWPNYGSDYRPILEFARAQGLEVLAANAPRDLAAKVRKQGIGAVEDSPYVARSTTAPDDEYLAAFRVAMRDHPGEIDEAAMQRYYAAQCLKDDTMAEAIVDRLRSALTEGRRPLVVHFCGHMHSDHRRGTVERIHQRDPELRIAVVGVENVPPAHQGTIAAAPTLADFVLLVPGAPAEPLDPHDIALEQAAPVANESMAASPKAPPVAGTTSGTPAEGEDRGARPGLGIRPDYDADVDGCAVADVVPGGAAEVAGIAPGDVILTFAGEDVDSVASYAAALGKVAIGDKVEVTVRRGNQRLQLPVVVGRSSR